MLIAASCFFLQLLAASGCFLLLLAASGCFWLLLAAAGCCWLLLAAAGEVTLTATTPDPRVLMQGQRRNLGHFWGEHHQADGPGPMPCETRAAASYCPLPDIGSSTPKGRPPPGGSGRPPRGAAITKPLDVQQPSTCMPETNYEFLQA